MALPQEQKRNSYADYLTWGEDVRCEAFDGQIYNMSPSPTPKHQEVLGELFLEFGNYLRGKECRVFLAPIDVCLFAEKDTSFKDIKNWAIPDLVVVGDKKKIDDKRIIGAPELVVEVLSPSTAKNDKVLKYNKYEKAGVLEYWIVDPYNHSIDVYLLEGTVFRRSGVFVKGDTLPVSIFKDFSIDLNNVFREEE